MLRFAKARAGRGFASETADSLTGIDIYDRYAGNLYRQALFTLDDRGLAEGVVSDVIAEEILRPAATIRDDHAAVRLAVNAYWRCMAVADSWAWVSRVPAPDPAAGADRAGLSGLTARERGVLGMVLFGGLSYQQAGIGLGLSLAEVAALLRSVLVKAADAEPGDLLGWPPAGGVAVGAQAGTRNGLSTGGDRLMTEQHGQDRWNVAEWHGKMLVDRNGEKIGKLQDVYVDVETDQPQFATVKEGLITRHLTFVPLGGIQIGPEDLQVVVTKKQVKDAPDIEMHGDELSQADESALYHHFELNYAPPNIQSGRRLARR
jgi:DNA-binding CsgD family transcriptional regulator/sporulation protein YlmC with PRC-barrel domain